MRQLNMLLSGREKLERMRDGRAVYIGGERVEDVTTHPAFRNAAGTIARLYDVKAGPAMREVVRSQNDREAPWARFHGIVDELLDRIPVSAMKVLGSGGYRVKPQAGGDAAGRPNFRSRRLRE